MNFSFQVGWFLGSILILQGVREITWSSLEGVRWDQVHAKVSWWFHFFSVGSPNIITSKGRRSRRLFCDTPPIQSSLPCRPLDADPTFHPGGGRRVQDLSFYVVPSKPRGGVTGAIQGPKPPKIWGWVMWFPPATWAVAKPKAKQTVIRLVILFCVSPWQIA